VKLLRIAVFASLTACSVSTAWAQYGLYGSPEMLRLPQQNTEQNYAAPAAYPSTAAPAVQPAPTAVYAPVQPQYGYAEQPQFRYPAQSPATAMYQPYQPGAQYRYPGPYLQPSMRTAAVNPPVASQSMPAPTGVPVSAPSPADALPPQTNNLMNQMLAEDGNVGRGCPNNCGPMNRYEQSACGPSQNGSYQNGPCQSGCGYDNYGCDGCGCGCPWYASASALALSRSEGRRLWTAYDSGNQANQLVNTQDIPLAWKWGGEISIGRRFCWCDTSWAVEATYWTTEAFTGDLCVTNPYPPNLVSTPLRVFELQFNGFPGTAWFDNAKEQQLSRRDEFQNLEVNLIRQQLACSCNSPWDIGWSFGVRYFRFEENLTIGSLQEGCNWGQQTGVCEAYLNDTVTNSLFGFQFGFDAGYSLCKCVRVFVSPKFGIYNDHMNQNFRAYLGNGVEATTGDSGVPGTFPVLASRDALAFLTQIDLGVDWQITQGWSARLGYRVLAMTGIALADDQFPQYIVDVPEIAHIDNHSSLILHGVFAGLTYNF
jgi:hypothetical protein